MKVKKYIAPSMQEAMKKIRSEMGNDAVILNSKEVNTGGFFGLFTKKKIEVIAAMDPDVPSQQKPSKKPAPFINEQSKMMVENPQVLKQPNDDLVMEIKELKNMLQSIPTTEQSNMYPEPLKEILEQMKNQEVHSRLRNEVMAKLLEFWYEQNGAATIQQLKEKQYEFFEAQLSELSFGGISYQKKYINVIGPTGVGKTTTLAKLAAECVIEKRKKVAFITTDTFRIAAIDQLKTYAKILNVPIEVCYNLDDFKNAKEKLANYDYILIDTAGRNFLESQYVDDLQKIIDFNDEMETFLVLAATAKPSDMLAVYEQFSVIPINKLIFTKLDETSTRGPLFDVMIRTKKGIAYTTHGQNVPDDIEMATKERIVEQILR
ncbi:flagellar biosynthesis protein FlhF [Metabacillus niabensis]|uniref:Flagellar biosynthesis protein FlhF n=1 Tax=Metabacillus niabensis TaxID=324854 RepID=A0ABT9Z5Q9_9BACI|nr:flagellar biosynthesis protein FlhF [Metabacillus niabensis]MDQ0227589.1 flagellar biosynthesis protein FlhF [Metabacillus niabensis]